MKTLMNIAICSSLLVGLSACMSDPSVEKIAPISTKTITVDGETYVVTRSAITKDKITTEGWSVVYDGLAVSCPEPTEASCTSELKKFKSS